jgi:hypothetical protein
VPFYVFRLAFIAFNDFSRMIKGRFSLAYHVWVGVLCDRNDSRCYESV